jgi:CYTH domain-containing protein
MKLELTNPKAWKKVSERKIPMESKIKVYEKLGGAYRLGLDEGEQVYNKLSELLKTVVAKRKSIAEEADGDHEVGMAMGQLDDIIKNATELKGKIGTQEMNMPGWIQDHISQSQNFINQANTGYHTLDDKK